jgi:hypothetical protein
MSLRASDVEATALGAAAAAGAALKSHEKTCLRCSRARKAGNPETCCDEGYEMVRTVHKANTLLRKLRADKAERKRLAGKLF